MRAGAVTCLIAAVIVIAARLCHVHVLWADDNLPLAAAIEVVRGKTLYRDVWFDKPPLVAWIALVWGAHAGFALRIAGAIYVLLVAALAGLAARARWSNREGLLAAIFVAVFLTFGLPSAVLPLASDMLLILPHVAAIYFTWRGRPFWAGVAAGIGLLCSSKALMVLAACALWRWREAHILIAGFAAPNAIAIAWMWAHGSLGEFYKQAWQWGSIYAKNTFVENPLREGLTRTANWIGFHAAVVIGAVLALRRERDWRFIAWIALAFAGVVLGFRFFPRYYFLLFVPLAILGAGGWGQALSLQPAFSRLTLALLLAIPIARFTPAYVRIARAEPISDLAIDRDSQDAAGKLRTLAAPGDTLFVWGFRPDIFIYSRLPAGTRFLESQAITGVLADRHLFSTGAITPEFTAPQRAELAQSHPTWVVDGLGVYNPELALARDPQLANWFAQYREVARTGFSILYRLR
jgi:hypothetical protein